MFGDFGKVLDGLSPVIFSKKNIGKITSATIVTATNVAVNLSLPYIFNEVISLLSKESSYNFYGLEISPLGMIATYGAVWAIGRVLPVLRRIAINPIVSDTTYTLVYKSMDHLLREHSHRYHISTPYSDVNELIQKCILGTNDFILQLFTQVIPTSLDVVTAAIFLAARYEWPISVGLSGVILVYTIYNSATATYIISARTEMLKARFKTFSCIASIRNNYETIHVFNNAPYELQLLKKNLDALDTAVTKTLNVPDKISLGQMVVIGLGFSGLSIFTVYNVINAKYTVNNFIVISYYLLQFSAPLSNFGDGVSKIRAATVDLKKIIDFLNSPSEIIDDYSNILLDISLKNAEIKFENVKFDYDAKTPILKGVTFTAPAGKKTGIVGISGAGKTTIARLLYRFYDVTGGSIKINGQDIREVGLDSLRSAISLVPQNSVLFNDTLRNNIWYGAISVKGRPVSDAEVWYAVDNAHLRKFVEDQPEKLDRLVGEKGAKISGGQLQRVAIARAILKDPAIYILDEATSALDSNMEAEIQKNLDEVTGGVTTLVITHRLSTLVNADWIVVLQDGKVIEEGTHEKLLSDKKEYANLWNKQVGKFQTGFEDISDGLEQNKENADNEGKREMEENNSKKSRYSDLRYSRFYRLGNDKFIESTIFQPLLHANASINNGNFEVSESSERLLQTVQKGGVNDIGGMGENFKLTTKYNITINHDYEILPAL